MSSGLLLQIDRLYATLGQHKGMEEWKIKTPQLVYCYVWGSDVLQELWLFALSASKSDLYLVFCFVLFWFGF